MTFMNLLQVSYSRIGNAPDACEVAPGFLDLD